MTDFDHYLNAGIVSSVSSGAIHSLAGRPAFSVGPHRFPLCCGYARRRSGQCAYGARRSTSEEAVRAVRDAGWHIGAPRQTLESVLPVIALDTRSVGKQKRIYRLEEVEKPDARARGNCNGISCCEGTGRTALKELVRVRPGAGGLC